MKIDNLKTGLHKTLTAAFRSQGLSEKDASAKATKHLSGADAHFHGKLEERGKAELAKLSGRKALAALATARGQFKRRRDSMGDSTQAVRAALRSVSAWAKTLP